MTIRFKNNSIEFESGTNKWVLVETNTGFDFTGAIRAQEFLSFANIGLTSGYTSGGLSPGPTNTNTIDKFPFATNANATDVGDLTVVRNRAAGQSSTASGYTSGGYQPAPAVSYNVIDKFPFASNANATDVGDLTIVRNATAGQSSSSHGYTSGGIPSPLPLGNNTIDKFPFASNTNATDVGDLTVGRYTVAGQTSSVSGYTSGGSKNAGSAAAPQNTIDKFPLAADANATSVGSLTRAAREVAGQNSTVSGYTSGGTINPGPTSATSNVVDKFPFSTDASAVSVGNLTVSRALGAGQSSIDFGYTSGGLALPASWYNTIDRFPYASDASATDVGDLTVVRAGSAAQQV